MKDHVLIPVVISIVIMLANCEYVADKDLLDPAHAYYVESGQKTKDRKKYEAAYLMCLIIFQPELENCWNGVRCRSEDFYITDVGIPLCAEALAGVPGGEFYKHGL